MDDAWTRMYGGLLAGAHHSLNNRLAALGGVVQMLGLELPPDHRLRQTLDHELERMRGAVGTMALLAADDSAEAAQPVRIQDVLDDALTLYGLHHRLRDVPCDLEAADDVPPVRIPPMRCTRTLLALLAAAAGRYSHVRVGISAESDAITIRIGPDRASNASARLAQDLPSPAEAVAAASWVEHFGGRVEYVPGDSHFGLRLPRLGNGRS